MSRAQQPSILSFFQPNSNKVQEQSTPSSPSNPPSSQTQHQQQQPASSPLPPPPPPPQAPPIPQPAVATQPTPTNLSPIPVTALPPTIPTPHPSATIVPVTDAHIPALRRINALLLPVNYTDSFYKAILDPAQSGLFSRAILFRDDPPPASSSTTSPAKVVGGLICRLEPSPFDPHTGAYSPYLAKKAAGSVAPPPAGQGHALYVQSLVLLSPFRGQGLAAAAVEGVLDAARTVARDRRANGLDIRWVYAHVWTENEAGLAWYGRRGFERDVRLEGYYFKLQPGSAWVVKKRVDLEGAGDAAPRWGAVPAGGHGQPGGVVPLSVTAAAVNLSGFDSTTTTATATATTTIPATAPPPSARPPLPSDSLSFQNKRPDMEWNDLPEDMVTASSRSSSRSNLVLPPAATPRSTSATGRKKKERAYPTAAFGA